MYCGTSAWARERSCAERRNEHQLRQGLPAPLAAPRCVCPCHWHILLRACAQLLAAGVNVLATVRSLGSPALQALQEKHGERLTVAPMDVGNVASIKVRHPCLGS